MQFVFLFMKKKFANFVINLIELLKLRSITSLSDTIQTNIELTGPKLV